MGRHVRVPAPRGVAVGAGVGGGPREPGLREVVQREGPPRQVPVAVAPVPVGTAPRPPRDTVCVVLVPRRAPRVPGRVVEGPDHLEPAVGPTTVHVDGAGEPALLVPVHGAGEPECHEGPPDVVVVARPPLPEGLVVAAVHEVDAVGRPVGPVGRRLLLADQEVRVALGPGPPNGLPEPLVPGPVPLQAQHSRSCEDGHGRPW